VILIPIGHEQDKTRRLPIVTFCIIGLCAVAFVATGFGGTRQKDEAEEAFVRAVEFWMQHPTLALHPEVERKAHGVKTSEYRDAFREGMRANAPDDPNAEALQAELDRLCATALEAQPSHPFNRFGLVPSRVAPVPLFAHMFLHAGWLHLLFNMLFFYLCGPFVEDVWGRPVFAAFYLLAGVAAAMTFVVPHSSLAEPLVGASGAIAGVMGAFLVRYWNAKIHFFYAVSLLFRGTFEAPAWLMLGLWFAQQLFLSALTEGSSTGSGGGVAYSAHIGGFAFGAGIALAMRWLGVEERYLAPAIRRRTEKVVVRNEAVEEALLAAGEGRRDEAWTKLLQASRDAPGNGETALALWDLAVEIGRAREAAPAMVRLVQDELKHGQVELAVAHWDDLRAGVPTASLDSVSLLRLAGALAPKGHRKEASDCLRRALLPGAAPPSSALTLKIARLAAEIDPVVARAALDIAARRGDLDPGSRAEAERIEAKIREGGPTAPPPAAEGPS
jgi:membrane associated rhomboid family serine protease